MKRKLIAAVGAAALTATMAACGSDDSSDGGGGSADSITVWLMSGSAPDPWVEELNAAFEEEHGVEVNVEIQQWEGIQDRLTTALSEDGTVDVLELGNTQAVGYANTGGLADLSELSEEPWTESMLESAVVDDTFYSIPWYGANRVVVYDQSIWAEAGAEVPTTRDEWIEALELIDENTEAEPIYLPGQTYYVMGGFVADEGGAFAAQNGDEWEGTLNSPEVEAGLGFYGELQEFSDAPTDIDEGEPQQSTDVVPNGDVASWVGLPWEVVNATTAIEEAGGEADWGFFPVPGKTADELGHVFLGGSNLAVAERAGDQELARAWLEMATSQEWSQRFNDAMDGTVVPNRSDVTAEPAAGTFAEAMVASADVGFLPPLTPGWANVEVEPNPIKDLMTKVLNGEDFSSVAEEADTEMTTRLNRE
ncbi:extracellular solute-binding protein [Streptomyces radicis]|uniref:Extracellular solute-binding protein n=1 Tax=Streptomyces radicis TaxID=1750517 RepID=A0A3A9W0L3_9ACTN|nr:extracellular solute-binding protein [Streptomyces radicis]RKN06510.1 extracellular solute-binding protein [Streptomyces radicis]RKN20231.1 extracellular solute-binding protein [Streptomyces radicis]